MGYAPGNPAYWTLIAAKGDQGEAGPQGPAGADGAPGPAGADGAQGPAGADGAQGPAGPAGAALQVSGAWSYGSLYQPGQIVTSGGYAWLSLGSFYSYTDPSGDPSNWSQLTWQGPQGQAGEQGPAGPAGADGSQGPQGPAGDQGPAGPAGTSLQVVGAWTFAYYSAGQIVTYNGVAYMANGTFYSTTTPDIDTANWTLMTIQGPAGANGSNGADGAQGPAGPAGASLQVVGAWSYAAYYTPGQIVTYAGFAWLSLSSFSSYTDPANDLSNWSQLTWQGTQGEAGPAGPQGDPGPQGPAGIGLPAGGTAGQAIVKNSSTDHDAGWADLAISNITGLQAALDGKAPMGSGGSSDIFVAAAEMIPRTTNGCGVNSLESTTNRINYDVLEFDAATAEFAQFIRVLPNNWNAGTVTFKPLWTAASGSGAVVWQLAARCYADDDALDQAMGTAQSSTDTLLAANDMHIGPTSSAITVAGIPAAGRPIIFQISRLATDAADTLAVDARLLGVHITYLPS